MLERPLQADDVYQWVGPRMGRTLLGTRQGSLVLTDTHLAFVTRGRNDAPARLVMATLGGLLPAEWSVALGVADAARGPLASLKPRRTAVALPTGPGSWLAPLAAVVQCSQVAFPEAADFERSVARLQDRN